MGSRTAPTKIPWVPVVVAPLVSITAFVVAYFVDPLNFGDRKAIAALPAFLLAVIVLLVSHNIAAFRELEKSSKYSDHIYEAVKDYLHVTKVGSPEAAFQYVVTRLPSLQEVRNTSFNLVDETERSDDMLYETAAYRAASRQIAEACARGVRWKDVGDSRGVERFRAIRDESRRLSNRGKSRYVYRLIEHGEPQMNFILLGYPDGTAEVLFNWDFRGPGQDPTVLLSRDRDIVEMFTIQFEQLWRVASQDHDDNNATRSTSTK